MRFSIPSFPAMKKHRGNASSRKALTDSSPALMRALMKKGWQGNSTPRCRSNRHGRLRDEQRRNQVVTRFGWWGEATDEPALARQSVATTAREDARPTEMTNCVTTKDRGTKAGF